MFVVKYVCYFHQVPCIFQTCKGLVSGPQVFQNLLMHCLRPLVKLFQNMGQASEKKFQRKMNPLCTNIVFFAPISCPLAVSSMSLFFMNWVTSLVQDARYCRTFSGYHYEILIIPSMSRCLPLKYMAIGSKKIWPIK